MRIAQFISVLVYALVAVWYVSPKLKRLGRADALIGLMWVHIFRYMALFTISAQQDGAPLSVLAVREIVVWAVAGTAIALAAIILLRKRVSLGVAVSWLLVIETIADIIIVVHRRLLEAKGVELGGVMWMMLVFFDPIVLVSVPMLIWQLYTRRKESLIVLQEAH